MDELLLNFLGREREKTVRIGERTCAMRLLSARETLSLRREIAQLDCADEEERALRANAALLKRSLTEGEEAAFASAEDVENALSVRSTSWCGATRCLTGRRTRRARTGARRWKR